MFPFKASPHLFLLLIVSVALGVFIGCTSIANAIFSSWAGGVAPNPSYRPGDKSDASQPTSQPSYPSANVPVPDYDDASRPYCEQLGSRAMPVTRCVFPLDSAVCFITGQESNISCVKIDKMDTLAGVKTTAL